MKGKNFSQKHTTAAGVKTHVREKILATARDDQLPCATAFKLAAELNLAPAEIGEAADLLNVELIKCQLGLFGYTPEKKIVAPKPPTDSILADAIRSALKDGNLPCQSAWEIAHQSGVSKMTVSAACEALHIKIKPCQLGAF